MEESLWEKIDDTVLDVIILKHLFYIQVDGLEFR